MSVTLFGIGLSAVLACASFVAYWYGWRIAKAVFYSATMITLGAVIIYTLGLPKMVSSIIVAAISCSVALFQLMLADPNDMPPSDKRKLRKQEQFRARAVYLGDDEAEELVRRLRRSPRRERKQGGRDGRQVEARTRRRAPQVTP